MSEITVYLTPKEPPVTKTNSLSLKSGTNTGGTFTFYIRKRQTATVSLSTSVLSLVADYIFALWFPTTELLWERDYHEIITGYKTDGTPIKDKILHDAIRIKYPNLSEDRNLLRPYWRKTTLAVRTPGEINPHSMIISHTNIHPPVIGQIPSSGNKDDFWGVSKQTTGQWYITPTPVVRPGEYIEVRYDCSVNGVMKYSAPIVTPYETPLFTGGWIRAKRGTGLKTRYDVEIFGVLVTDIMPTDFYNYQIDKWVYLIKANSDIPLEPQKVDFGSSRVEFPQPSKPAIPAHGTVPAQPAIPGTSGDNYRIVPIDFGGQLSILNMAVPPFDALQLDSATNFAEVFDMKNFLGHVKDVTSTEVIYSYKGVNGVVPYMTTGAFNYCPNSTNPAKGTNAVKVGDTVILSQGAGTTTPKVIGVPKKLCPCTKLGVIISTVNGDEAFAWDIYNNKIIVEKSDLATVQAAVSNLDFSKIKECIPDTEIISEPTVPTNMDILNNSNLIIEGTNNSTDFNLPYFVSGDAGVDYYPNKQTPITFINLEQSPDAQLFPVLATQTVVANVLRGFNDLGQPLQPQPDVYDYDMQTWVRHKMINKPSYLSGNTLPVWMEKKGAFVLHLYFFGNYSSLYQMNIDKTFPAGGWSGDGPNPQVVYTDFNNCWNNYEGNDTTPQGSLYPITDNEVTYVSEFYQQLVSEYEASTGTKFITHMIKDNLIGCGYPWYPDVDPNGVSCPIEYLIRALEVERNFLFTHSLFDCDKESEYYNDLEFGLRAMCRISKKDRYALIRARNDILSSEKVLQELDYEATILTNSIALFTVKLKKLPNPSDAYTELQTRIASIQQSLDTINADRISKLINIKSLVDSTVYLQRQSSPLYDSFVDEDVRDLDEFDFDMDRCGWDIGLADWYERKQAKFKTKTCIGIAAEDNDYVIFESMFLTMYSPDGKKNTLPIGETSRFVDMLRIWTHQDNLQNDEFELMELINNVRTEPLHYTASLEVVALRHAKDMMLNPHIVGTTSTGSDGSTLKSRIEESTFLLNNQYIDDSIPYKLWTNLDIGKVSYTDVNAVFPIVNGKKTPAQMIADIDISQLIMSKYLNIGIGLVVSDIGDVFVSIVVAQNEDTWAGMSPVDTAPMLDYIKNNFSFTNNNAPNTKVIDNDRNLRVFMIHTPMPF